MRGFMTKKEGKLAILILLTGVIALFHYAIPTDRHTLHMVHIVLRKLYFLPPIIAAVWFGLRGAVLTTLSVSVLFSIHAFLDWPGNYMEQANQMGELASFWIVGLVSGWLFERQLLFTKRLASANEETYLALISALDLRERNTYLHSRRVRDFTLLLADRMGVSEEQKHVIGLGALLHDVGKIAISDRILMKPDGLNEDEKEEIRKHPAEGYRLLEPIGSLAEAAEIVRAHHERFDGSGYPIGLKGEDIPLGARIFAVADVYDALTSERIYHTRLTHEEAVVQIQSKSGTDFDPKVVQMFLTVASEEFTAIRGQYPDGIEEQGDAAEKE